MKMKDKKILAWWSGGATSAVSVWLAIQIFGKENVTIYFLDTKNEDADTYRFKDDCERWYGIEIKTFTVLSKESNYQSIRDIWRKFKSLNVATGAICSTELKRKAMITIQKELPDHLQVFGYEFKKKEMNRALGMALNNPDANAIFPLLMFAYDKPKCIEILKENNIEIPRAYEWGFHNNNCLETGCVQGGIGYWQHMKVFAPHKFNAMADEEHFLTDMKGRPVTMLKDQSSKAKESGNVLVFLKKHPDYPDLKCIDDMPKMKVTPLLECNGFCGPDDLVPESREFSHQLNFDLEP